MSGDMWTTLANSFTNACLTEFVMRQSGASGDYLVEGDDGFIAVNRPLRTELFKQLGFSIKMAVESDLSRIHFCSLRSVGNVLVPDIFRSLSKYGKTLDPRVIQWYTNSHRSRRCRRKFCDFALTKAMALLTWARGIPILQAVAHQQIRIYSQSNFMRNYYNKFLIDTYRYDLNRNIPYEEPTAEVRDYVAQEWGVCPADQVRLEREILATDAPCYEIHAPGASSVGLQISCLRHPCHAISSTLL